MKHGILSLPALIVITLLISVSCLTQNAEARAGSGSSMGSRGSRSYSPPAASRPTQQSAPYQATQPSPYQSPQPAGGGFFRSMAGGIAGGLLGGMLFRGLGFGGGMGGGGGGIGLFEILLIGGIIYLIYRFVKKRNDTTGSYQNAETANYQTIEPSSYQQPTLAYAAPQEDVATGLNHIRQMDYTFDEQRFTDGVMDLFFKIQGAWMNRDLSPAATLLTTQMRQNLQSDIDTLLRDHKINRLENIAVRSVQIIEAWQESGQDYITTLVYANLLDYTTDDAGQVISGSKTDPVKFEEYWTVTRPVGNNPWQLSAIDQK
jgi:predicted lipid-binding transport protein (Tim44 family)